MQWLDYTAMILYIIAVLGIGFYFARSEKNSEDYLLGGRNMPFVAVGLSCMMSLLSSVSIVRVPGEILRYGLTLFSLIFVALLMVVPAFLLFTRFYFKLGSFTPYEYLEYRYNGSVRTLIALVGFYSKTLYLAMVLFATSKIFQGAYGWDAWQTILLVGIVGTVYTVMGGMKAVIWSDVMQFVVLAIGYIAVVTILCIKVDGGAWGAISYTFAHGHGLDDYATREFYTITPYVRLTFWMLLISRLTYPLTDACSNQINIQRLLSTKDWKTGLKSQIVSTATGIPFTFALLFVGIGLFAYYSQHPDPTLGNPDTVFFHFVSRSLPSPLPGVFMAAMLAAIMSTLDSGLNSLATIWLKEVHQKFKHTKLSGAQEVKISRATTLVVGIFVMLIAILLDFAGNWMQQSIAEIGKLFDMILAIVLPTFLFAVLSRRVNATLIWILMIYSIGEHCTSQIWYAFSTVAVKNWIPGEPLGWGGPLSWNYALLTLVVALTLLALWFIIKNRITGIKRHIPLGLSLLCFGATQTFVTWSTFSHIYATDQPMARSFAFNFSLPVLLIVGAIVLRFFPVQPEKKWRGLTIWTVNDNIIRE